MEILQAESDRTVLLEVEGTVVRKVFHSDDPQVSLNLAEHEFNTLRRFRAALADVPSSTCPRPLELIRGDEVCIRMERASGVPLQDHLARREWRLEMYEELATSLGQGLVRYVETFGEPYWDFILRNMFYDETQHLVTFLDFGFPLLYVPRLAELRARQPIEVSLGALVASAIFDAGRPKRMSRRREHDRAFRLARETVHYVDSHVTKGSVRLHAVRETATELYMLAASGGGRLRQEWYRRVGPLFSRPATKLAALQT